jgi:hypothetical protein
MKKPSLISLAMLLILLAAGVCRASDSECDRHHRVANQVSYDVDDKTYADSIRSGSIRFHNLSIEICGAPTRIGNLEFNDFDEATPGTSTRIGGMIFYNVDW